MGKSRLDFSQRITRTGEWTHFGTRSYSYSVIVDRIAAGVDLRDAEAALSRYGQIDSLRAVGTNDDGTWAAKVTFFTRKQAKRCHAALGRDKSLGPAARSRLQRGGAAAPPPVAASAPGEGPPVNVLPGSACMSLLNAHVGFARWSTTILGVKLGGGGGAGGVGAAAVVGPAAVMPAEDDVYDPAAAAGDENTSGDGSSADEHARPAAAGAAAAVGAAELGLIAMARATMQLPANAFDAPLAVHDLQGFGDIDLAGLDEEEFLAAARSEAEGGGAGAHEPADDDAPSAAAAAGGNGDTFVHQSIWVHNDEAALGKAPRAKSGIRPMRPAGGRVKPAPAPVWTKKGPCVHATVAVSVTNPDGAVITSIGRGGCGCGGCLSGAGTGYAAPLPTFAGGGDGGDGGAEAAAMPSDTGFRGAAAEAASGRALTAVQLRELSDRLTAELGEGGQLDSWGYLPPGWRPPGGGGDGGGPSFAPVPAAGPISGSRAGPSAPLPSSLFSQAAPAAQASSSSAAAAPPLPQRPLAWAVLRNVAPPADGPGAAAAAAAGSGRGSSGSSSSATSSSAAVRGGGGGGGAPSSSSAAAAAPGGGGAALSHHEQPGVFAQRWAARTFTQEAVTGGGMHYKTALSEAFRDACVGLRLWVPP